MSNQKTLIVGYGNPDRQDDGVAWHVLAGLADALSLPQPQPPDLDFPPSVAGPHLLFTLQLTPELAEEISGYNRVCFVDAHTGSVAEDLHFEELHARFQTSPLTHHMTPQTILSLSETLYQAAPAAVLVSIRGYEFEFSHDLSAHTALLAQAAVRRILDWMRAG